MVGDPFEDGTKQGPVAFRRQFDKVMDLSVSKRKGDQGLFIEPTLFGDIKDDMRIVRDHMQPT